jgi:hypothetical protein
MFNDVLWLLQRLMQGETEYRAQYPGYLMGGSALRPTCPPGLASVNDDGERHRLDNVFAMPAGVPTGLRVEQKLAYPQHVWQAREAEHPQVCRRVY